MPDTQYNAESRRNFLPIHATSTHYVVPMTWQSFLTYSAQNQYLIAALASARFESWEIAGISLTLQHTRLGTPQTGPRR